MGAPHAVQVADRSHLLRNLREALEHVLAGHTPVLEQAFRKHTPSPVTHPPPASPDPTLTGSQQISREPSTRTDVIETKSKPEISGAGKGSPLLPLRVIIPVRNGAHNLRRCLESGGVPGRCIAMRDGNRSACEVGNGRLSRISEHATAMCNNVMTRISLEVKSKVDLVLR